MGDITCLDSVECLRELVNLQQINNKQQHDLMHLYYSSIHSFDRVAFWLTSAMSSLGLLLILAVFYKIWKIIRKHQQGLRCVTLPTLADSTVGSTSALLGSTTYTRVRGFVSRRFRRSAPNRFELHDVRPNFGSMRSMETYSVASDSQTEARANDTRPTILGGRTVADFV